MTMEAKAEKKTVATAKKPAAAKKTTAPAAETKAAKAPAAKAAKGARLVVVQHGSTTCVKPGMRETLAGLGLGRTNSRRELEDTPAVRGMIRKVRHLVHIEGEK